jgi:hypothetical protein
MTNEMMTLRTLLEKNSDADLLREMIGFTAQRLMELEVEGLTGPAMASAVRSGLTSAMATATGRGRPAPGQESYASPSCGKAATSRAFWSRAGSLRRPWRRWCGRPTCTASPPARSMISSRRWA